MLYTCLCLSVPMPKRLSMRICRSAGGCLEDMLHKCGQPLPRVSPWVLNRPISSCQMTLQLSLLLQYGPSNLVPQEELLALPDGPKVGLHLFN